MEGNLRQQKNQRSDQENAVTSCSVRRAARLKGGDIRICRLREMCTLRSSF